MFNVEMSFVETMTSAIPENTKEIPELMASLSVLSNGEKSTFDDETSTILKTEKRKSRETTFPSFEVFRPPVQNSFSSFSSLIARNSKRRLSYDAYRPPEMSPEITLIEFISTSAAFHGVKRRELKQLEWDILKVFNNNIMPANAAAWYMAKRRFYLNNVWENQLLPFLLKKYPDKFTVKNQNVEFLDTYAKDVAKKKMSYMIHQGLYAYFSHKADEYGVYFFDPYYYENTEPFHANLRATVSHGAHHVTSRNNLISSFFNGYKSHFSFVQHSSYLVTISKSFETKVITNTTGIIVSMIDHTYGIIQFPSGSGTEKALFTTKALYNDGWQYQGDPLRLDTIQFDGYQILDDENPGDKDLTWYAVLVWIGRKPSPKFCATREDLRFLAYTPCNKPEESPKPPTPTSHNHDSMNIGEVLEIRRNGAVVSNESKDLETTTQIFIPGWRRENIRKKGFFLTTIQGVGLSIKDLIGYYIDPTSTPPKNFTAVGHQVIVLKHAENPSRVLSCLGSPNTRNGVQRQFASFNGSHEMKSWKMLQQFDSSKYKEEEDDSYSPPVRDDIVDDSSEYESFNEADDVSDDELYFLRDGIIDLISIENNGSHLPDWRSIAFLQKVMVEANNAINNRNADLLGRFGKKAKVLRSTTPSSSRDSGYPPTSQEVTPTTEKSHWSKYGGRKSKEAFWRMRKAFKCLETYNSDEDPSYEPSEPFSSSEDDDYDEDNIEDLTNKKRKNQSHQNQQVLRTRRQSYKARRTHSSSVSLTSLSSRYASNSWMNEIMASGILYCPHTLSWILDEIVESDLEDPDYVSPQNNVLLSESENEVSENELKGLQEDLLKELTELKPEPEIEFTSEKNKQPGWLKYLLEIPLDETSDNEEYIPPSVYMDTDHDYDEYSDGEISDSEVKVLMEESKGPLLKETFGPCLCGKAPLEKEHTQTSFPLECSIQRPEKVVESEAPISDESSSLISKVNQNLTSGSNVRSDVVGGLLASNADIPDDSECNLESDKTVLESRSLMTEDKRASDSPPPPTPTNYSSYLKQSPNKVKDTAFEDVNPSSPSSFKKSQESTSDPHCFSSKDESSLSTEKTLKAEGKKSQDENLIDLTRI